MMKRSHRLFIYLLLLFGITLSSVFFLTCSITGSRWTFALIQRILPKEIHIESFKGILFGKSTLQGVSYQSKELSFKIQQLQIESLLWKTLLSNKIKLSHLYADHIELTVLNKVKKQSSSKISLPKLPIAIDIDDIQLKSIHIITSSSQTDFDSIKANARISINHAQITGHIQDCQQGDFTFNGHLKWYPSLNWKFSLNAHQFHVGSFWHDNTGIINFKADTEGKGSSGKINISRIDGQLYHQNLQGHVAFSFNKHHFDKVDIAVSAGNASLFAKGSLKDQWQFRWNADIPHLEAIIPSIHGQLFSQGELTGPRFLPLIKANLNIRHFQFKNYQVDSLTSHIDMDALKHKIDLTLKANQLKKDELEIDTLNVVSERTEKNHSQEYSIKIKPFQLTYDDAIVPINEGLIIGTLNKEGLSIYSKWNIANHNQTTAMLSFPRYQQYHFSSDQPMKGNIHWQSSNLQFFSFFVPYLKNVQGQLNMNVDLGGTLKKPELKGDAMITEGDIIIPNIGIHAKQLQLTAKGDNKLVLYEGVTESGGGQLQLTGKTIFDNKITTQLSLQGNRVLISNTPNIKIFANPTINVLIEKSKININGQIIIPEARLKTYAFDSLELLPDDIVYVNQQKEKTVKEKLQIFTHLRLILGDHVTLKCKDIEGKITGYLTLDDEPEKMTTASGQLEIHEGTYTLYGHTLDINHGQLNYTGNAINNPLLNIRASKIFESTENKSSLLNNIDTLTVGIMVSGTAHDPHTLLFSDPAGLSQTDILSYLLLGIASNEAGEANAQLLLEAANALDLGGSNIGNLQKSLKHHLGLSEIGIGTESKIDPKTQSTVQHTSFNLGKRISSKFSINYSVDLFDHTNTFKARYNLKKKWILQSESNSKGKGVDLLYTIEKD